MQLYWKLAENGEPIPVPDDDVIEWARWLQNNRRVAEDFVFGEDGSYVSTVFLGVNHNFGDGPPVLWETMVFGGPHHEEMARYTSREAALIGHQTMLDLLKNDEGTLRDASG